MGFHPSRSCNNSLVTFTNYILRVVSTEEFLVAAFLDITGAFDNVHPLAISELKNAGAPASIKKFVENLIIVRTVYFIKNGIISDKHFAYKGSSGFDS